MKKLVKIEYALLLIMLLFLYFYKYNFSWIWLFVLILVPDISAIGYLINTKIGAYTYNAVHSFIFPTIILIIFLLLNQDISFWLLIWFMHILMDRSLGYGLKYTDNFKHTNIDRMDN
ncbi:DUF4260 family protein [Apilactobacillus xinyiensis]|uniref:DUF4260 family protein n=1 Tax=Apilactobacillus xinyiensis TaxID=2841032 RepID=UPI0024B14E92|nr:DUF4260 family protein [Apilactobacillus xinyiensis]